MAVERLDLSGEAAAFVALHHPDDLGELGLIPFLPCGLVPSPPLFPVVHVEPLDVADVHRRLHLLLALDEDGLDVSALHANGDGNLIAADAGITGGVFREEGNELVAAGDAVGDPLPPVVACLDLILVEPDIVPAHFEIALDAMDEFLVLVVPVAEEEAERQWRSRLNRPLMPAVFADPDLALSAQQDVPGSTPGARGIV